MGKSKRNSRVENKQRKPLRAAKAQVSAPETTVTAQYRSAIGVDVHLNLLVCTYQTQLEDHREIRESRDFLTDRKSLDEFTAWCYGKKPEMILMESTGVLWYSPYEALEDVGFSNTQLALINARDAKAAAGRKTDRKDASRLSDLARSGHFRKSFVPPKVFREMRFLAREMQQTKTDRARYTNRYQKLLNATGCRASTVFSDVHGKAASKILDAKLRNDPKLKEIIKKNCSRLRATPEEIESALNFEIEPVIAEQLIDARDQILQLDAYDSRTFARLAKVQRPYKEDIKLLMTIKGVQERAARLIYAELCPSLKDYFEDSESFCSWMGICPGDNTSAGKKKSGKCPKGNKWLRRTLIECANGLSLSKEFAGADKFQAIKMRRGRRRAIVALAHFLARVVFSILTNKKAYFDPQTTAVRDVVVKRYVRLMNQIKGYGELALYGDLLVEKTTGAILATVPPPSEVVEPG